MNREEFLDWLVMHSKSYPTGENGEGIPMPSRGDWRFLNGCYHPVNHVQGDPITINDWNCAKIKDGVYIQVNGDDECDYVEEIISGRFSCYEIIYDEIGTSFHFPNCKPSNKEIFIEIPRTEPTDINAKVLAEKVGSSFSAKIYDDLRDAHYDLVNENMQLQKELEAAQQRIKNLHRAINDAKSALDE